jgi:hypothetical protein
VASIFFCDSPRIFGPWSPWPSLRDDRAHLLADEDPADVAGTRMLKTMIGSLLSRQREMAVLSITLRPRSRASCHPTLGRNTASGWVLGSAV